ncbi:hypothetical protein JCM8547_007145 [Rhodosporidiobolus lusitaniae]
MSSAASSSTYLNTIPNATQVVPSVGLDGKPTKSASPSSDNGGDTFPLAAIAVVSIVGGIAFLFAAYQVYKRLFKYRRRAGDEPAPFPETRSIGDPLSPGAGAFVSLPSQTWGGDSMGRRSFSGLGASRSRQASWGGDSWGGGYGYSEKGDMTPSPPFAGTPLPPGSPSSRQGSPGPDGANDSRGSLAAFPSQASMNGLANSSTRNSLAPTVPRRSFYSSAASGPQLLHSRTASSFSSSPLLGGNDGRSMHSFPSGNRLSGAPHNPHSRIEVVPPLPLAPPPGQVIATDKSTLDFAPSSGIGRGAGPEASGTTGDEFLSLVHAAGRGEQEERLNPAFDGSYVYTHQPGAYPHPHPHPAQHSFPPPQSTASSSSRSSSAAPRRFSGPQQPPRKGSAPNLRGGSALPPAVRAATAQSTPSVSANSSDSNLSSASSSYPPPSQASRAAGGGVKTGRGAPLSVNTSAVSIVPVGSAEGGEQEPRSPLEKLQRRMEREARGLSMEIEKNEQGAVEGR